MKNEFINRLESFDKTLNVLAKPENKAIWENKKPEIFTLKAASATTETGKCKKIVEQQEKDTTGAAEEKAREQKELDALAEPMADAVAMFFRDQQMETEAAEVTLSKRDWDRLRDAQHLAKARLVEGKARALTTGPHAAAAAQYGITGGDAGSVAKLQKEADDVERLLNAPANTIGQRARFTAAARPQWRTTEAIFADMDELIVQYQGTEAGNALVADYLKAREINDRGHGPSEENPTTTTTIPAHS